MHVTSEQRDAIETDGVDLVVVAGAGSGKTHVLVERYVRLLKNTPPDQLLAVTFTDKAAREMRDRVRKRLDEYARNAVGPERVTWEERRAEIEGARMGTIHSFCGTLLRAHPAETGLDPGFEVLDEVRSGMLLRTAVDETLAALVADHAHGSRLLLDVYGLGDVRAMLRVLVTGGSEVAAAAKAMPADAHTLLERWHAAHDTARTTAITDLRGSPAWLDATQAVLSAAQIAPFGDRIGVQVLQYAAIMRELPEDPDAIADMLQQLDGINLQGGAAKQWGSKEALADAKQALRSLRDQWRAVATTLVAWDDALEQEAALVSLALAGLYHDAVKRYTTQKRDASVLDYDDLEQLALDLLNEHADVRAAWQQELAAILVDEFQDTNPAQRDLIYALAGVNDGCAGRLFVLADGKQSIYRFRGADVSVFNAVRDDVVQRNGKEIVLSTSFRAHQRIVGLNNHLFQHVFARSRPLHPYEVAYQALEHYREPAPHTLNAELHVVPAPDKAFPLLEDREAIRRYEAQVLARRIRALVDGQQPIVWDAGAWRGLRYGDIAMLFQASTVFSYYEEALRAAGVPFLTTAGRGYYERNEVRDLVHLQNVLDDPADEFALIGVLRSPLFAVDDATLIRLRLESAPNQRLWDALQTAQTDHPQLAHAASVLAELHTMAGRLPMTVLLREALRATGYMATLSGLRNGDQRRANVEKLIEAARRAGAQSVTTLREYLDSMLRQQVREGEAPLEGDDVVRIMTVHRAKGLEFPVVVLPDLSREGIANRETLLTDRELGLALKLRKNGEWVQPAAHRLAQQSDQHMERAERERLAYVAMTRAKDYLILAGSTRKSSGNDWLSWLNHALGWPWEAGGPQAGVHVVAGGTLELAVERHDGTDAALLYAGAEHMAWDRLDG